MFARINDSCLFIIYTIKLFRFIHKIIPEKDQRGFLIFVNKSDINYTKLMDNSLDRYQSRKYPKYCTDTHYSTNMLIQTIIVLLILVETKATTPSITDNTCVFREDGKLFTLTSLNRIADGKYYRIEIDNSTAVEFNLCNPFFPKQCPQEPTTRKQGYSFMIKHRPGDNGGYYQCTPFSSDSKINFFEPQYIYQRGQIKLYLSLFTNPSNSTPIKRTDFILDCQQDDDPSLKHIHLGAITQSEIIVYGSTPHACPVFEINSIWKAISDNLLIFGAIMFIVGFVMLFFGVLMTPLMIFIAAYLLSLATLPLIASTFLRPDSSTITIYFALLAILFLSTLVAYGLARLVNASIFFIGAFFGFIVAAIVNSIFCKVFDIYSIWSLITFQVIFTIPFGMLTFKYSEEIIVLSTSLARGYMMVRPLSWIIGGFPNEFTLYLMIQSKQIKTLPWFFFIYLLVIIAIAIVGALYQLLQVCFNAVRLKGEILQPKYRQTSSPQGLKSTQIKQNRLYMITLYAPDDPQDDYKNLKQMQQIKKSGIKVQNAAALKERRSRQQNF